MATHNPESDGSNEILQDESCGHILFNPPNQPGVFAWDYDPGPRFSSEDEALDWHDTHCATLLRKGITGSRSSN